MFQSMRYMSLWELAHRWEDAGPAASNETPIPVKVQDVLRSVCFAVATGELYAVHPDVVTGGGPDSFFNSRVVFDPQICQVATDDELLQLACCTYDRALLKSLFVSLYGVFMWATNFQIPLPDFAIPPELLRESADEIAEVQEKKPTVTRRAIGELQDRAMVQGAAVTIWCDDPVKPIAQVIKHPAIKRLVGGKYVENTLRSWVIEVAPATVKRTPGRPKSRYPRAQNNSAQFQKIVFTQLTRILSFAKLHQSVSHLFNLVGDTDHARQITYHQRSSATSRR